MQKVGKFKNVIKIIENIIERLGEIISDVIPETFPVIEPPEGNDDQFNHMATDFPNMFSFLSVIPDSSSAMSIIEELQSYISSVRLLVEDLYPREMISGDAILRVETGFESIKYSLGQFEKKLVEIQNMIMVSRSTRVSQAIDLKAMRSLKNHITRIGWEYIHKDYKLPSEFISPEEIIHNNSVMKKIDRNLPPQIEQFRTKKIGMPVLQGGSTRFFKKTQFGK